MTRPPVVLTIAGSDPSGGAGIQADLKTFGALGAYGCAVLTALTAQSTRGVTGVHAVPPEFVREQVATLVEDITVDTVKIGMLGTAATVDAVAAIVTELLDCEVVLDPVMVSTSGSRLLDDDAVAAMRRLVPLASVITPNLHEAAVLLDTSAASTTGEMRNPAEALLELGAQRVLLKGGHGTGPEAVDVWAEPGSVSVDLHEPRVDTGNTHGTGCSLSAAMAALRPRHDTWLPAVREAKHWLTGALVAGRDLQLGHGPGPVDHFHATRSIR